MSKTHSFSVKYGRDESGWWVAQVVEVPSAITQGRSLAEARRRIREALAVALDDERAAAAAEFRDLVQLPAGAKRLLASASTQRAKARLSSQKAEAATCRAALKLTKDCGFSVRDAGEMLGLSHQRVQQIVSPHARPSSGRRQRRTATDRPRQRR